MAHPPPLRELQQRLGRLIAAREPSAPCPHGDPNVLRPAEDREREAIALGVRGDDRVAAGDRVGIYVGMYFVRLRDAIAEDYPVLRAALGDAAFEALLRDYVAAHPPASPSLRHAADQLAEFTARHATSAERPWLGDLARFERALIAAFDAPDEAALRRAQLDSLPQDAWLDLALQPMRSLVLLEPGVPVDELHAALLSGSPAADDLTALVAIAPPPGALRVWRQDLRVYHRRVARLEADALEQAQGGVAFAALCAWVQERDGSEEPAQIVLDLLERWLADGLLVDTLSEAR